jgi:hypothetical protein
MVIHHPRDHPHRPFVGVPFLAGRRSRLSSCTAAATWTRRSRGRRPMGAHYDERGFHREAAHPQLKAAMSLKHGMETDQSLAPAIRMAYSPNGELWHDKLHTSRLTIDWDGSRLPGIFGGKVMRTAALVNDELRFDNRKLVTHSRYFKGPALFTNFAGNRDGHPRSLGKRSIGGRAEVHGSNTPSRSNP